MIIVYLSHNSVLQGPPGGEFLNSNHLKRIEGRGSTVGPVSYFAPLDTRNTLLRNTLRANCENRAELDAETKSFTARHDH